MPTDRLSLVLTVNDDTDMSTHSSTTLCLIYKSDIPFSNHSIYTGKLSWSDVQETHKAVDESIFVVAPRDLSDDTPVLTLWQWTVLGDGGEKINVDYFSSLHGADSGHHQNAAALKHGGFTLSFTKYENSALETLALYKSGAIEHSRVMLTLLSQTNTITNDTTSPRFALCENLEPLRLTKSSLGVG